MALARELEAPPKVLQYFHVPPRRANFGPGWYMGPDPAHLTYIGFSSADAEVQLLQMVRAEEEQKAGAAS
jgi:hypothetical protein